MSGLPLGPIECVELRRVTLPLHQPFATASGVISRRDIVIVRVITADQEGWGECPTLSTPSYGPEYTDAAALVLERHLAPLVLQATDLPTHDPAALLAPVAGHHMAKFAIETAILDAALRRSEQSLAAWLGGPAERIAVGAAIPLGPPTAVADTARRFKADGYRRLKLKVMPGADHEPVAAARDAVGVDTALFVDANGSYPPEEPEAVVALARFGDLGVEAVEQPFPADALLAHARLAATISPAVALDESIVSLRSAADAIELGACTAVNVKPARVGGVVEAKRIHDHCAARRVPIWCGGMLEAGIGRAAAVAVASLPGFTRPAELSASDRYFEHDLLRTPFVLDDGCLRVPTGPGLGVDVDLDVLAELTTARTEVRR